MTTSLARALVPLMLGATLVACGGDEPAVCGSADNLKTSVENLKDVNVTANGVSDRARAARAVRSDRPRLARRKHQNAAPMRAAH